MGVPLKTFIKIKVPPQFKPILCFYSTLNPLSPKSDQHEISPHNINALENMVVVRIEYMIREDESI